ncbi:MAG: universal stress protein [Dechloromonas sp.]|nr:universal stress protein [Dechloromonas sp.]
MYTILLAVDGGPGSLGATDHVVRLLHTGMKADLHVLNVQIPVDSGHVRLFVEPERIEAYYREEGLAALAPACQVLDTAGLAYHRHLAVGHVAETIAHYAQKIPADQIVLGAKRGESLRHMLLGSVARDVAEQTRVPVTFAPARG